MKKRLDLILFERGLFKSREKAKEEIEKGNIFCGGKIITKSGVKIDENIEIKVIGETLKYVSRAGLKLEFAAREFNLSFNNLVVLDAGASTGGFTDYCLQNGAKKVYAVDVGHGQLDTSLTSDPRVINLEGTNIKALNSADFGDIDIIVTDLSFISLTKVCEEFSKLIKTGQQLVALIKPQFELTPKIIKRCGGVVKKEAEREEAKQTVINHYKANGFDLVGVKPCAVAGRDGNIEYLALFKKI